MRPACKMSVMRGSADGCISLMALRLSLRRDGDGVQVVVEDARQCRHWLASEAAIGAKAELGQIFARGCDSLLEPRHIVNGSEIDARALWIELAQRREERIVAAVEHWDVNPVDRAARC